MTERMESPVVMIVFRRPEITRRVFSAVANARPKRLFIIADGPRANSTEDSTRCEEVRKIVTSVSWPCQLETNFAEHNMGLRPRVVSGLNWVFSKVEDAIILEDDCLPHPSFFPYCCELLDRYRDRHQIASIAGFNPMPEKGSFEFSYYYSLVMNCWGWATWRRAWKEYDDHLESWPEVKQANLLYQLFPDANVVAYWGRIFDMMYRGEGPNTWDYPWVYTCWKRNWLTIVPRRNMIENIGLGPDSTHTSVADPAYCPPVEAMELPLRHPPAITPWPDRTMRMQRRFFSTRIMERVRRRLRLKFHSRF